MPKLSILSWRDVVLNVFLREAGEEGTVRSRSGCGRSVDGRRDQESRNAGRLWKLETSRKLVPS